MAAGNDARAFGERLKGYLTLVATGAGAPVGFISLKGADHIEMLYVHPAWARQGVATQLLDAIEKLAEARGAGRLTADASDTARPFFESKGYEARFRQTVVIGDHWLGNTRVEKICGDKSRQAQAGHRDP